MVVEDGGLDGNTLAAEVGEVFGPGTEEFKTELACGGVGGSDAEVGRCEADAGAEGFGDGLFCTPEAEDGDGAVAAARGELLFLEGEDATEEVFGEVAGGGFNIETEMANGGGTTDDQAAGVGDGEVDGGGNLLNGDVGGGLVETEVVEEEAADGLLGGGSAEEPFETAEGGATHLGKILALVLGENGGGEGVKPEAIVADEEVGVGIDVEGAADLFVAAANTAFGENGVREGLGDEVVGGVHHEVMEGLPGAATSLFPVLDVEDGVTGGIGDENVDGKGACGDVGQAQRAVETRAFGDPGGVVTNGLATEGQGNGTVEALVGTPEGEAGDDGIEQEG